MASLLCPARRAMPTRIRVSIPPVTWVCVKKSFAVVGADDQIIDPLNLVADLNVKGGGLEGASVFYSDQHGGDFAP